MNEFYVKLQAVIAKVDGMTLRERLLLLAVAAVVLHMGWSLLFWQPLLAQEKRLKNQLASVHEENQQVEQKLVELGQKLGINYNADTELKLDDLMREMAALEARSSDLAALLVAPEQMAQLLEQLLLDKDGLRLVRLENSVAGATAMVTVEERSSLEQQGDSSEEALPAVSSGVYRHGFMLELEGEFFSILGYLQDLEALPQRFFWDAVEYDVDEYPRARVRIRLHTLSLSEGWVGV